MPLFKLIGLLFLFLAAAGWGFSKSEQLRQRAYQLEELCKGISQLSEYIRGDGGNKSRLIERCFCVELLLQRDNKIIITAKNLTKEDRAVAEEFFIGLGQCDREAEYRRARLYYSLLEERYTDARKAFSQTGRLYTTLGILCGVFLCIFFI